MHYSNASTKIPLENGAARHTDPACQKELSFIVDLMRDISKEKEPQAAANLYGTRLTEEGPVKADVWMSLSRRDLNQPWYRITRSSTWEEDINPWTEKEKLPLLDRGLLSELIYSNEPAVVMDLQSRIKPDDPAKPYFRDMNMLLAVPHFDEGHALNMSITMVKDPSKFPLERFPNMVWVGNLWGRATLALVLRKQLKDAYDELDREVRVVENIQRSLLPQKLPEIPGVELAAYYQTSRRAGGLPLGVEESMGFEEHTIQLQSGDALLLYTDGITEALSASNKMFGLERLDAVLARPIASSDSLIAEVMREVNAFVGTHPVNDDRTLLAMVIK